METIQHAVAIVTRNDILMLGAALLFVGTCQLFRKAS